jgi:hypothetical protein
MSDHRATWVRLRKMSRHRFSYDPLAAEITVREAFDAEESVAYAADLDAQVEEQGILEAARAAKRLLEELREELRGKGSGSGNEDDDYLHLDDDELDADFLAELPTDAEAAAEQRALMSSFETQRRDQSARQLMAAERRAVAQQRACHSTHCGNMAAPRRRGRRRNGGRRRTGRGWRHRRGGASTSTPSPPLTSTRTPSDAAARFMRTAAIIA